jgi:membrane fusion protein, multidrug efflux system
MRYKKTVHAMSTLPILSLLASLMLVGCNRSEPEVAVIRPVRAMQVLAPNELLLRSFPGLASASTEVNLSFRVGGPLISRAVNVGDDVRAGDVVAQIDPTDFSVRLQAVEAQLERSLASKEYAQTEYNRIKRIMDEDPGATSEVALDTALRQLNVSSADVDTLQASVKAAQDQLKYTQLVAPFDGRVVATYVENFEDVLLKQPIMRILDRRKVEFSISVPESLIGYAPFVENVTIAFDAYPDREFIGRVKEIGEEATQATRTYPVKLILDQPDDIEILAGMAGVAKITSRPPDLKSGISIPATSVFSDTATGESLVWVCDPSTGRVSKRVITATQFSSSGLSVEEGLSQGEWIMVAGVHTAREDQQYRIVNVETGEEINQ